MPDEVEFAVWGFEGEPPALEGGVLASDDRHAAARDFADLEGASGGAACYRVRDAAAFEAAVDGAKLVCANLNEVEWSED